MAQPEPRAKHLHRPQTLQECFPLVDGPARAKSQTLAPTTNSSRMFSKTPRKSHQEKIVERHNKENETKLLLASDSHTVILLNALPLASVSGSMATVLPKVGLACMTLQQNICVWDYINV
jgi:hypothetical protein